jgi:hypothetical protein
MNNDEIIHTDDTGEWLYAVQVFGSEEWLDAFDTYKEAVEYCEVNGHTIEQS